MGGRSGLFDGRAMSGLVALAVMDFGGSFIYPPIIYIMVRVQLT